MPRLPVRRLLVSALALLAGLLPISASAQGRQSDPSLSAQHLGGVHIVKAGPNGGVVCDLASEAELAEALAVAEQPVNLTLVPSLNEGRGAAVSNFRILLRATDQLIERPQALQAFRRAAARWERVIQSNLTVVIDVDYGPKRFGSGEYSPGVIASANSALQFFGNEGGPREVVARLKGRNTGNAQLQALYNAIPLPTPSTYPDGNGGQNLRLAIGGVIPLQALGVRPANYSPDPAVNPFGSVPNIGFNSAFNYDFDPNDGIGAQQTDFEAVVAHEIGHALAFTSAVGFVQTADVNPLFTPWDLFRVRPEAVTPGESLTDGAGWETALRVVTPGPVNTEVLVVEGGTTYFKAVQVTFDGDNEFETSTATGNRAGGDGQQASHWRDDALRPPNPQDGSPRKIGIMDPTIGRGEKIDLSFADIRLLQLTGFEVNFNPPTATLALSVGGSQITESLVVAEVSVGDVAVGGTRDVPITLQNTSAANALNYEIRVVVDEAFPEGVSPTVTLLQGSGTAGPSSSGTATLRVGGVNQPAFVSGRLQVRSNDAARAFIEVPFTFSVGGATEPNLTLTSTAPASGDLGDIADDGAKTFTVELKNTGSLPLDYVLFASVAARDFNLDSTPTGRRRAPLFTANFESPANLSQFAFDQLSAPDRWQVTAGGRATLPGHSASNVAYFGPVEGNTFRYSNNSFGQLATSDIDASALDPSDLLQVSFRYFLKAEAGFDIASVLVSIDGGASYRVIATSDGGILANTVGPNNSDPHWEAVTVSVPGVAGLKRPIKIAFRFESDTNTTDEGWFIDDIVVEALTGGSGFFTSPLDGTLAGGASRTVTVSANGAVLDRGFYRGSIQVSTNQRTGEPDPILIEFTVGNPTFPTLALTGSAPNVSVAPDTRTPLSLAVRNPGDALLSFVRVLEPAASDYEGSRTATLTSGIRPDGPMEATVDASVDGTSQASASGAASAQLAQVDLPGAALPGDITQLPDGRILVADIGLASAGANTYGQTFLLPADLSSVTVIPSPAVITTQITGLTYNNQTQSIWMGELATGLLREFRLDETASPTLVPTGTVVNIGFGMVGLSYSPELDAMITTPFQSEQLLAIDVEGNVLPGYPVLVEGRASLLPGVSITEGVVEIGGADRSILQVGQFGRPYAGSQTITVEIISLGGSGRINGYTRSRLDPNGVAYYVANPTGGVARVFSVDPPDIAAELFTRVEATEPLFADQSVDPREEFSLSLTIDSRGLTPGTYADQIAFLTNDPVKPLVRVPVQISVMPVSNETTESTTFTLRQPTPNPARSSAQIQFDLPAPTQVTVEVYNALGQRVAMLAEDAAMAAGPQQVTFETGALAAGLYIVRVRAGDQVASQKLTVLR